MTWVVENADDAGIAELRMQLEMMEFYTVNNSYDKLLEANEEFHNMIYSMAGSRFIVQVLKSYQDYVHTARRMTLKKETDLPKIYEEHAAIYRALAERNAAEAVRLVGEHLDNSCARTEERWQEAREKQNKK